ncbi:hypothetical protein Ctha_1718 [Chloroherpeton thalassium ATCC 35110]|uniref:Uncharacterized protein n=1 Tax=Chloroherpeton thalassium (strain ATCC 35110 / GB-78) TaxID=517418 RepID=B3QT76_CHLT3|nr:hypothetical protein [Chloroherpeton thalassium]ACF14175.1 hypothetical protein Ctha_1718 [Chloroherpeton thalassium ATCC 35110]
MTDEKLNITINSILEKFVDETIGENAEITYSQLANAELPEQIKGFLWLELDFAARRLLKNINSSQFDFSSDLLADGRREFAKQIIQTASLTRAEYLDLLQKATVLHFHYLSTPQRVLLEIIFEENSQEQLTPEIQSRLRYFSDYIYLIDVFLKYLEKKKVAAISATKFKKIISDIDRKIVSTYNETDFLDLLFPLYNIFALGNESEIPISILIGFLKEKDASEILISLQDLAHKGIETLSLQDMRLIFEGKSDEVFQNAIPVTPTPSQKSLAGEKPQPKSDAPIENEQAAQPMPASEQTEPSEKLEPQPPQVEPPLPIEPSPAAPLPNAEPPQSETLTESGALIEHAASSEDFSKIEICESEPQPDIDLTETEITEKSADDIEASPQEHQDADNLPENLSVPDQPKAEPVQPEDTESAALPDTQLENAIPAPIAEKNRSEMDAIASEVLAELSEIEPLLNQNESEEKASLEEKLFESIDDDAETNAEFILDDTDVPYEEKKEPDFDSDLSLLNKIETPPSAPIPSSEPTNEMTEEFFKAVIGEGKPRPTLKEPKPLPDLKTLIDEGKRKRFIRKLFRGNEYEYDDAIAEINKKKSWREASVFIDMEIFTRNKIDEDSSDAIYFTDIVFSRYN